VWPLILVALGAVAGCGGGPEPVQSMVFCYRTLADVDCYRRPDAGRDGQLVGVYARSPDDPSDPLYWLARADEHAGDDVSR
jgi:hypothetical protein